MNIYDHQKYKDMYPYQTSQLIEVIELRGDTTLRWVDSLHHWLDSDSRGQYVDRFKQAITYDRLIDPVTYNQIVVIRVLLSKKHRTMWHLMVDKPTTVEYY